MLHLIAIAIVIYFLAGIIENMTARQEPDDREDPDDWDGPPRPG